MDENLKNYSFHDFHPPDDNFKEDVIAGLSSCPRSISPKYFYDQQGSKLFDQITELKDYYPTRCELNIFESFRSEILNAVGNDCVFIEPGAGNGDKGRKLLDILEPSFYAPIDISKQHLINAATQIARDYPGVEVSAVCSDFTAKFNLPDELPLDNRVIFFPGSSIGNFHPDEAFECLAKLASHAGTQGKLLIGVDLKKDETVLQRAYDDSEGITAQFNLNLLSRINHELSADFDLDAWQHHALYNSIKGRIEMHLLSLCPQVIAFDEYEFYFEEKETIHTENSYKYSIEEFQQLARQAGFISQKVWLDKDKLFSVHLFVCG
ncbi:MAG: L-histidine N(alpha)-methyltransferase [Pseudomonadota bacterium]